MIKFKPVIIEDGLIQIGVAKERKTVRAIITNDLMEVLMVYSKMFNDYTFPGGGIKHDEDETTALHRELKEELGALSIEIKDFFGQIQELRYGLEGDHQVYLQTSYYYHCHINQIGEQELIGREIMHGVEPRWIKVNDALKHNMGVMHDQQHQVKGLKTVLIRENTILRTLEGDNR